MGSAGHIRYSSVRAFLFPPQRVFWSAALLLSWVTPPTCAAQCRETPTVQMDERTAGSHLLAKKDLVLPERIPRRFRIEKVVLLITVDREGAICEVQAKTGPKGLRHSAVQTVKEHWRYRRFLVDWKPVVAQFPVTVKFLLPKVLSRETAQGAGRHRSVGVVQTA